MPREVKATQWDGEPFRYAHAKRDGIWLELIKDPQGNVSCWTRQPRDMTKKLMWHPVYVAFEAKAPKATVLYCELWVDGAGRDAVKGAVRDKLDTVRIECFAVEKYDGKPHSHSANLEECRLLSELWCGGVPFVPYVESSWLSDMFGMDGNKENWLTAKLVNTEGWMLKDGNLLNWRKLKVEETYDLIVVGFTDGRKKYEGQLGALVLESSNGRQVRCSGMTDEQRRHMTDFFWQYQGKIVEVECQGRGSAGGLAHPRFVRVREDKTEPDALM